MTQAENVVAYLWSVLPDGATNSEIAESLGIGSHQIVFMITRDLMRRGLIRGDREGRTWTFYGVEDPAALLAGRARWPRGAEWSGGTMSPAGFEALAGRRLSERYGVALSPGSVSGVHKRFDFVSPDRQVIGDAKYYTLVGGVALPPAKFSIIAEHVWLLEKTRAPSTFLVFGNDRRVPSLWLERYGNLARAVAFYFLTDEGGLDLLTPPR